MPSNLAFSHNVLASLRYRAGFRRDGVDHWMTDTTEHMITDAGLDKVATVAWASCFNTCLFSDAVSPTPVFRHSGGITFTQATTVLTASGGFFVAGDVGRLFKFGVGTAGVECYITGFTSATIVAVSVSQTVASATQGTVWYVNLAALDTLLSATNTYVTSGGSCGSSAAANVVTMKRTYIGGAVGGSTTLTSIAFSNSGSNSNVFDRDVFSIPFTLIAGDQPLAVCELILTCSPGASNAVGNVATGYDSSGNDIISGLGINSTGSGGIAYVDIFGDISNPSEALDARDTSNIYAYTATFSLPTFNNGAGPNLTNTQASSSIQSYSSGNFYREVVGSFATGTTFTVFGWGTGGGNHMSYVQLFTASFTKLTTQTLSFTFRKSWQRVLNNPA